MTVFKNAAEHFADIAHSAIGQKRKYTLDPYINHPRNVAYLVQIVGGSEEMIAAAYLHDVLEDVMPLDDRFNGDEILKKFGYTVYNLVLWLTDPIGSGNRAMRKEAARDRLAMAPAEAKTIKLADLIDNSLTIVKHDPGFAKVYLKEKRELLDVLKDGNANLWHIANQILVREGY